ncbi:DUF5658 family protein [Cohnella sp. JJ-181]|uniref:DUF5658 family protein n=1 Tax=Cohnella rhizoplanae TaxID=2974897 RepID=UPI0022FF66FC|nr:DUF5658 family protein [Cohnella sp. JJ-181]CAI6063380.1 hypothetical protein COHCIP112018_01976 [Cohnella sp. JJ-181]
MMLAAGNRVWNRYLLLVLSVFDALATDTGIRLQLIGEANPIARALYETNVVLFYAYKTLLPLLLLFLLRHAPERRIVHLGTSLATALYGAVALYHAAWILYAASVSWP